MRLQNAMTASFVVLLSCGFLPQCAFAQASPRQASQPLYLEIAGYRVSLGMTIDALNTSLGGVVKKEYIGGGWVYGEPGRALAKVFVRDGRVTEIVKLFQAVRPFEALVSAHEEFQNLVRGRGCTVGLLDESPERVTTQIFCGPYTLEVLQIRYGEGRTFHTYTDAQIRLAR